MSHGADDDAQSGASLIGVGPCLDDRTQQIGEAGVLKPADECAGGVDAAGGSPSRRTWPVWLRYIQCQLRGTRGSA